MFFIAGFFVITHEYVTRHEQFRLARIAPVNSDGPVGRASSRYVEALLLIHPVKRARHGERAPTSQPCYIHSPHRRGLGDGSVKDPSLDPPRDCGIVSSARRCRHFASSRCLPQLPTWLLKSTGQLSHMHDWLSGFVIRCRAGVYMLTTSAKW